MQGAEQLMPDAAQVVIFTTGGFSFWQLVAPVVTLIAVCVAFWGICVARRSALQTIGNAKLIARRRATIDLVEKVESTPHYTDLMTAFSYYRRQNAFLKLSDPREEREKTDRRKILNYLNHYEIVAIGIRLETLDEDFYSDWMQPILVRDWNAASAFVQRERWKKLDSDMGAVSDSNVRKNKSGESFTYQSDIYVELQALATKWSKEASKLDINSGGPPDDAHGPGDERLPETDGRGDDGRADGNAP